jgi:hypothetical protein
MNYQEKLEEIIRETDNMDIDQIKEEIETMPYIEKSKVACFLWGFEKGIKVALHLAEKYKINGKL